MARNVFVSFRFSDGEEYKNRLCEEFDEEDVIDYSEKEDRSHLNDDSIKEYLYKKLKETSITIVILTPKAINYEKNELEEYDDWLYHELRFSLEDRKENRTNGVIALYTDESKDLLFTETTHKCEKCKNTKNIKSIKSFDNLVYKNLMNVKEQYKKSPCLGIYDSLEDSYCSLVHFDDFLDKMDLYLDNASRKRDNKDRYEIVKRM